MKYGRLNLVLCNEGFELKNMGKTAKKIASVPVAAGAGLAGAAAGVPVGALIGAGIGTKADIDFAKDFTKRMIPHKGLSNAVGTGLGLALGVGTLPISAGVGAVAGGVGMGYLAGGRAYGAMNPDSDIAKRFSYKDKSSWLDRLRKFKRNLMKDKRNR